MSNDNVDDEYGFKDEKKMTIFSAYDRVKAEILNRYYAFINNYTSYKQYLLLGKHDNQLSILLTSDITILWTLLKDYEDTFSKGIQDYEQVKNTFDAVCNMNKALNDEGIRESVRYIATIMRLSGLTDISYEKFDPGKAMSNMN